MKRATRKHLLGPLAAAALMSGTLLYAGPQGMFGISYTWGGAIGDGNLGISLKIVSDDEKDKVIGVAGVTYYPWAPVEKFGADLSAGYLFDKFALTGGYDFLQSDWIISGGYVNTKDESSDPAPASVTPPPTGGTDGPT